MISIEEFVLFCNRTLDGYERALARLDESTANAAPELPFTKGSTPAQLVTHALGATRWWTSHIVCGHSSDRDRDSEFEAVASLPELASAIADFRAELDSMAPELAAATALANEGSTQRPLGTEWTVGAALIHAYEELAQHLGHLEMTVDLLAPPGG